MVPWAAGALRSHRHRTRYCRRTRTGSRSGLCGSAFIATHEANAPQAYKQMIVDSTAADIVYSNYFSGVHGNYLKPSIAKTGFDPENLPHADPSKMSFANTDGKVKAWRATWRAGHGVG